jgi:hypothetical protein
LQHWQSSYIICFQFLLLLVLPIQTCISEVVAAEARSTVTFDPGFGCGNKYWGIKNYQNKVSENTSAVPPIFGRLSGDCTDNTAAPPIPDTSSEGIRNYARLHAETTNSSNESIAWQATFQGVDPWGFNATRDGQALANNNLFPLSAELNYSLDVTYLWINDNNSRPHGTYDNLKAGVLVDLWFAENYDDNDDYSSSNNPSPQPSNSVLVIDLALANLENVNGRWRQDPYLWEGVQYYEPFAQKLDNGQLVYYYNVVIDVDGKNPGVWYHLLPTKYPKSLDHIISDAFSYDYRFKDGIPAPSLERQNFNLVDIEAGAEVWNDIGASGELTAGFSVCNLTYTQVVEG